MSTLEQFATDVLLACRWKLDEYADARARLIYPKCDSPIERMFGAALWILWDMEPHFRAPMRFIRQDDRDYWKGAMPVNGACLCPQFKVDGYRLDFYFVTRLAENAYWEACIECDGHDFHERTKEQAARDKSRDRAIATHGMHVFRFTGSEIHKSAMWCAVEIVEAHKAAAQRHAAAAPR